MLYPWRSKLGLSRDHQGTFGVSGVSRRKACLSMGYYYLPMHSTSPTSEPRGHSERGFRERTRSIGQADFLRGAAPCIEHWISLLFVADQSKLMRPKYITHPSCKAMFSRMSEVLPHMSLGGSYTAEPLKRAPTRPSHPT